MSKDDMVMDICYRLAVREEQAGEALYRQLVAASCSQDWVLVGDCSHLTSAALEGISSPGDPWTASVTTS